MGRSRSRRFRREGPGCPLGPRRSGRALPCSCELAARTRGPGLCSRCLGRRDPRPVRHGNGDGRREGGRNLPADLETGLGLEYTDIADVALGHAPRPADLGDEPLGIGLVLAADVDAEPVHVARFTPGAHLAGRLGLPAGRRIVLDVLGRRQLLAVEPHEGTRDLLGRQALQEAAALGHAVLVWGRDQQRILQHALVVLLADLFGGRRPYPLGADGGGLEQELGLAPPGPGNQQDRDTLSPRPPRPARAVEHALDIGRDLGVDDQAQVGQVEAARGHVSRDADPGMAPAQGLEGLGPQVLGQLARQAHHRETPLAQGGSQVLHPLAGVGEDEGARRLVEPQKVHDRQVHLVGQDPDSAVLDVPVRGVAVDSIDAQGVALIGRGQADDLPRQGRRKQEGAPVGRGGLEQEGQVLLEAHVEHFVGFIEDHRLDR